MVKKNVLFWAFLLALLPVDAVFSGQAKPNILLITMDTTRADHFGCYGYLRNTTPHIDAVARSGVIFENAYSVIPLTTPSHISIMTGLHPDSHLVYRNAYAFNGHAPLMAEYLKGAGYHTAAFVSTRMLAARLGFKRGFDYYSDVSRRYKKPMRPGDKTVEVALGWLKAKEKEPFFVWIHLYDPHLPYEPPLQFGEQFNPDYRRYLKTIDPDGDKPQDYAEYTGSPEDGKAVKEKPSKHRSKSGAGHMRFPAILQPDVVNNMIDAYDGEIAHDDYLLGNVFKALKDKKAYDRTAIIIMADHGEILYEQEKYFGHHKFLYEGAVRIPLIIKMPGVPAGRSPLKITIVDVLPTLLDFAGLKKRAKMDGISYWPHIKGGRKMRPQEDMVFLTHPRNQFRSRRPSALRRLSFTQAFQKMAVRQGEWKLLLDNAPQGPAQNMLFDLAQDPGEQTNLYGRKEYRQRQSQLEDFARQYLEQQKDLKIKRNSTRRPSNSTVNDLRSLGYTR